MQDGPPASVALNGCHQGETVWCCPEAHGAARTPLPLCLQLAALGI